MPVLLIGNRVSSGLSRSVHSEVRARACRLIDAFMLFCSVQAAASYVAGCTFSWSGASAKTMSAKAATCSYTSAEGRACRNPQKPGPFCVHHTCSMCGQAKQSRRIACEPCIEGNSANKAAEGGVCVAPRPRSVAWSACGHVWPQCFMLRATGVRGGIHRHIVAETR